MDVPLGMGSRHFRFILNKYMASSFRPLQLDPSQKIEYKCICLDRIGSVQEMVTPLDNVDL